jgi:CubicO group peptidase (beta-lactamase class C family)
MISQVVKETIERHLQEKQFSACALGIQVEGRDPEYFTVGKASLAVGAQKIDSHSLFDIASITKAVFTATLAADAFEKGSLQPDDKLKKWIPDSFFQNYSIEDLLLHQARFRPRLRFEYACPHLHEKAESFSDLSKRIMQAISISSISTSPAKVVYSDPGFILMAEILSSIFNESSDVSWQTRIQEPMKLFSTKTMNQIIPADVVVASDMELKRGEVHDPDARYIGKLCGHAGLFSSIEDMVRFGSIWLRDYLGENIRFKKETVQRFIDPYIQSHERVLGWDKPSDNSTAGTISKKSIGHLGFTGTSLWIDLEKKCVVGLLTNRVIMGVGNSEKELKEKIGATNSFRREVHNQIWETCLK